MVNSLIYKLIKVNYYFNIRFLNYVKSKFYKIVELINYIFKKKW
jgi:hypothetical protein